MLDFLKKRSDPVAPDLAMHDMNLDLNMNSGFDMPGLGIPESDSRQPGSQQAMPASNLSNMGYNPGSNMHEPQISGNPFREQQSSQSYGQSQVFAQPTQSAVMGSDIQKDLQILSLKLDNIKSQIDSLNQRVVNIERIAEREQQLQLAQQQQKRWY